MSTPWPEGNDYEATRAWRKTVVLAELPLDGSPLLWDELLARSAEQSIPAHAVADALVALRIDGHVREEKHMGRTWWRRTEAER